MRNILLCATFMLLSLVAHAQQALWGSPSLLSPEIHPDNTVTFRYRAPKAVRVQVTGDFLPQGQVAELTEVDGIWQYTTPQALQPELYSYSFIVDGVKAYDPNNVYLIRDVATVTNVFLISGDRASLYAINDVPHGTVSKVWYNSETLGLQRRLSIYTPAGYEASNKRYPVFYLLHGMGGDENAWLELGRTSQILDNLIAQGKAEPMIVVMTNGNAALEAAPGESSLGFAPPTINLPKTMEGSFETAFPEVVSFVDKHYRTIRKKDARAIAGLSMGGFHALHISRTMPKTFDYVGLFSAATMKGKDKHFYDDMAETLKAQRDNGFELYWIGIGKEDFLWKMNVEFRKQLDAMEFPYTLRISEGGHTWRNWRIYLSEFAPMLFK